MPHELVVYYLDNEYDVKVDRSTKWGNPFRLGFDGTRDEVCDAYEEYLLSTPKLVKALPELKGKVLACHCAPKRCHAEILAKYANNPDKLKKALAKRKNKKKTNPFSPKGKRGS